MCDKMTLREVLGELQAIYESVDPDEEPDTLCILVDGHRTGKYYTSKEYKEGTGSQIGRKKAKE